MMKSRCIMHLSLWLRRLGVAMAALCGLYLSVLAIAGFFMSPHPSELAVVFGNTVGADGQPSPRLRARLEEALALYHAGTVRRVMVSGGIEQRGNVDEAKVMGAWLAAQDVPRSAIVVDSFGTDTLETARHAAVVAEDGGSVVAVSQWFHLPRAILAMRGSGLRHVSGAWPWFAEPRDAYSFLREAVAFPVYALSFASILAWQAVVSPQPLAPIPSKSGTNASDR